MVYLVIEVHDVNELVQEVNKSIKDGWEPHGGLSVTVRNNVSSYDCAVYTQAMIRRDV